MPTEIVAAITTETFRPYAKLGKSNGKIQGRICDLLFRLIQTDDPAKVKDLCLAEVAWLENEYSNPNTRTSYITAHRKALKAYFDDHTPTASLLSERQTSKGMIAQHCALDFLLAAPNDYAQKSATTKEKTAKQRDNLTGFDAAAAIAITETLLRSNDWRELAAGLIMASQSRPSDMLKSGEFKAISKYRLSFTSRAKKRGKSVTGEIFCLVDSAIFIDAFSRLRRDSYVMEMKDWTLTEIDSGKNKMLNRTVKRVYGEVIPVPHGEVELSCKNLRASGVNAAFWLHGRDNQSIGRFAELQLLHDNAGTAANYEDYYAADASGKRLLQVGILKDEPLSAKPQSEQRSSLSLDKQLLEMISDAERWGEGSHADRLERIIARAQQADRLERQLALECEKSLRLELRLSRLQQAQGELVVKAVTETKVKPAIAVDEPTGFDWRDVSNEVLKKDRRNDAYKEKLRRSVEAIQEYNAGRELSEQYGISNSLLRQMAKVKPEKIKEWMDERQSELDSYRDAQGHTYQQNKGKVVRDDIKWSEQAYGAYEW